MGVCMGQSDPISYSCVCPTNNSCGLVLLFYRYWTNAPLLPSQYSYLGNATGVEELAAWHRAEMERHGLAGKARIASEGFNVTLGGTRDGIAAYISACLKHWSFSGLPLSTVEAQKQFFKPSTGCACVFGPDRPISVRVTAEITPLGVTGYLPADWNSIEALSPPEFHRRCHEENEDKRLILVDVRNHYESRIGYFVSPRSGKPAVRPPIRRFSQWPLYVKRRLLQELGGGEERERVRDKCESGNEKRVVHREGRGRQIMTYCTGGIRCEKGARWMQEQLDLREGENVCTLQGGIAAYLTWIEEEIKAGQKRPEESLFRGRNYVFDARGSTGLSSPAATEPVATCHVCGVPSDHLSKCRSKGCHLVLVVCRDCDIRDPRCCKNCCDMEKGNTSRGGQGAIIGPRLMCSCEKARETELWGSERATAPKTQGSSGSKTRKKANGHSHGKSVDIDIAVKIIDRGTK